MKRNFIAVFFAVAGMVCHAGDYFVKEVVFPAGADSAARVDMASRVVPTPRQMAWQELELTAFLHFGINTFTDREWGDGQEDPATFNPVMADCDQWVRTLGDAGFKMVILTAKHHDGFCLWPTSTTAHSVASSPWSDGRGDVVRDLREACDRYGMKLGLYLSPWDRNAECYGDSERYNSMFVAQLTELLSNYGKIDEVWFDGACGEGPNGKKQEYDWARFKSVIEKLQPDAVTAIMGDDVRWVGNENGTGRLTEWSVTPKMPGILPGAEEYNSRLGLNDMGGDLGSRGLLCKADGVRWWPSEVDVSIRPGWFYHDREKPKSLRRLAEIYLNSVGRNSVLLLNVPPDRNGLIASSDSTRLIELRHWLDSNFGTSLLGDVDLDKCRGTLKTPGEINCVELGEDISKGQQIESFDVEVLTPDGWHKAARGTTVGYKRILTFAPVEASEVRIVVTGSRGNVTLRSMGAYRIELPESEADNAVLCLFPGSEMKPVRVNGSEAECRGLEKAFDGDASTSWTSGQSVSGHEIEVDMGCEIHVDGFVYTPGDGGGFDNTIFKYEFQLSRDGVAWTDAAAGEFGNVVNNPIPQHVFLDKSVPARYFRLRSKATVDGSDRITIAELSIIEGDGSD
ncbi:MAG: alpha-L-fucosidase [Paramuribaculum sp.]|nr:alpha-L-fucosidase [Paramuribaculum sp.]